MPHIQNVLVCGFFISNLMKLRNKGFPNTRTIPNKGLPALGSKFLYTTNEKILTVLFFISALMSKEFIHLHKSDQRKLLARNVPLYVQYVLARYINSDSGYEQIRWLLGRVCEIMSSEESKNIVYICRYPL